MRFNRYFYTVVIFWHSMLSQFKPSTDKLIYPELSTGDFQQHVTNDMEFIALRFNYLKKKYFGAL